MVIGLAEVSWQAGHRGKEKEQREREEEQACKLCDDYQKTQGPSVLHPARAGRHRAGSLSRCAGWGNTGKEGGGAERQLGKWKL